MNLYTAAVYSNTYPAGCGSARYHKLNDHEKALVMSCPNLLESYHYVHKQKFVDAMRSDGAKVFLDSGAFSAFTLGVTIDLPTYCNYIKQNGDLWRVDDGVRMVAVLDGIGDPLATYRNQLHMEYLGVKPVPCFHAGEDERYLEYYVAKYDYIALGGMVGASNKQLIYWLDRMWSKYLIDGSGRPKIKVHGFGVTAIPVMIRYPWYSVDSSSWIQTAAFGSIMTPKWGQLSVSEKSPSKHDFGQHLTTLTEIEKEIIIKSLYEEGFEYERLSTVYESRAAYNLYGYNEISKILNEKHDYSYYRNVTQELF